jgi:hypothetical protein
MDPGGLHQQVFEEELDEDYEPTAEGGLPPKLSRAQQSK